MAINIFNAAMKENLLTTVFAALSSLSGVGMIMPLSTVGTS